MNYSQGNREIKLHNIKSIMLMMNSMLQLT